MAIPVETGQQAAEQRFRAALISSAALHVAALLVAVIGPLVLPMPVIMPDITPVRLISLPPATAAAQEAAPAAAPEPESPEPEAPEPEASEPAPVEAVVSEPEAVPRNLEQLRRDEQEARRLAEEEAQRQRDEAEARRRREEEDRKRKEEEARRQPQKAARRSSPTPQTARRQGIDLTGTEEGDTSFTVEDFPFAAYLLRIRELVAARWSPPPRGAYGLERRVEVFFRLDRNGRIAVQPRPLAGSGDALYDQAAMRAIAAAAPFPPLPREYQGQSLGVRFAFVQE